MSVIDAKQMQKHLTKNSVETAELFILSTKIWLIAVLFVISHVSSPGVSLMLSVVVTTE